jgi:hypothetical protein
MSTAEDAGDAGAQNGKIADKWLILKGAEGREADPGQNSGLLAGPRVGFEYQIRYCESSASRAGRQPSHHYF